MDKRSIPVSRQVHSSFTSVTMVSGRAMWSICRCVAAAWNRRRPCTPEARSRYACICCRTNPHHRP